MTASTRRSEFALHSVTLVNAVGNGLFTVAGTLFFVQALDMTPVRMGLGLTLAAALGLAASVPVTRALDGRPLRAAYMTLLVVQAVAMALLPLSRSFGVLVAVLALGAVGQKSARAVNNALIGQVAGERRAEVRATSRSVNNLGTAGGALLSTTAVVNGTDQAYELLVYADAVTFLLAAALVPAVRAGGRLATAGRGTRSPASTPSSTSSSTSSSGSALRDRRYLSVTLADGVMCLEYFVITLVLPLWVVEHTSAPRAVVPALFALNMLLVAVFQIRISRRARTVLSAARSVRLSGGIFLISLTLLVLAGSAPAVPAVVLLVTGIGLHTVGEMCHAAGASELSYGLAPEDRMTEYQGVFGLGMGVAEIIAPYALVVACLDGGRLGWAGLALLLFGTGATLPLLVARPRVTEPAPLVDHALQGR
ncbi:MFS transporter [Streptomyces sp. HUAS MG47]|uniref:MFS transporter n=1 Tax=Streptomyces solicamelliae TaxID=3231716 RepID=UPI003877B7AF